MNQPENNLALFGEHTGVMPAYLAQRTEDQGAGNEAVHGDDMAMPVLNLLNALSPQVEELEGAKAGMFHNSITDELYDSVNVINLNFIKDFAVFRKQNRGGGFNGSYPTKELADAHIATLSGNVDDYDVFETGKHIVLLLDDKGLPVQPMLVRMKSTGLQVSRNWNAAINVEGKGAARFATVWKLEALKRTNSKGSWYVMDPKFLGWAPETLYSEAKTVFEATKAAA